MNSILVNIFSWFFFSKTEIGWCEKVQMGSELKTPQLISCWLKLNFEATDYGHPMKPFVHLFMFSINQPIFLQKTKPLYPNPKYLLIYLGLEFEFGPQRSRDLAIVCPQSVFEAIINIADCKGTAGEM